MKRYKRKLKLKDKYKNLLLLLSIYTILAGLILFYIKRIETINDDSPISIDVFNK